MEQVMQRPTRPKNKSKFKIKGFLRLIAQIKPKYWQLGVGLLLGMIATGMQLAVPKFAKDLINQLGHHLNTQLVIGVILLFVASALISAFSGAILGFFGENVVYKLRGKLWQKLLVLPVNYYDETKSGEITSRLVNDSTQVKDLLANSLPNMATSLLQLVGAFILMLVMDWKMTIMMFIAVPLVILAILPVANKSRKIAHARQDALADFNGSASEILSEVRLVKSSNAEAVERQSGHNRISKLYQIGLKEAIYDSVAGPLMTMVMMGMVVAMLAYGASRVAQGTMDMGTLFSFLMYLVQMVGPFATLGQFLSATAKASGSTDRIQELLGTSEENQVDGHPVDAQGQTLSMNKVDFAYEDGKSVLNKVSFEAKPNSIVAFAGPSGGGKSTIFSLLERFYQPTGGTIKIGNQNLESVNLTDWREQIGLVSQDAAIMAGTIRYNLTYGLSGQYSDEQLWHVLEMAYAKEFVEAMPDGLDTQVGERGVKVSGGQRQRLAIARAFLRDPKILMLDEATASLDSESEMMVQKALEKLMHNRTTLVIAHRLSTIVDADQIYFIEKGHVSGHGTHKQLVAELPLYREYVENQMSM
ncbi:ABC transporter ATP-binding protein [Lentilactobacillus hilgardii]|uniref:Multidrug resistance ABC transporter ATP-binding and permease protein n=1 Tax=Lentilactobacillus hilgardii TaxID=1588 RepID=A0A6P1E1C8_LENHI|nr:ABC transporter ATP-binding protein [Lentilactobacillus hilgardii]EEI71971.1 ABC transporter, ATP-binding protein [Lentilactobacillus hilgardii ATCC 27305]MCT3391028.1 ABC transporter ATP-binding protein [Lentilactobacillus hilgardii]QHB51106.1 ATP-binding cassette domain-containing protein [Lentilactobacillus hilgardii]RRG12084.1 MAG: ABC transporter ATP-binding protein [Lactobacillus sp.]